VLRNAIAVRTSKAAAAVGDVGVFINVRPASRGVVRRISVPVRGGGRVHVHVRTKASALGTPDDPFYWHFVNFGTVKMGARHFLEGAAKQLPAALDAITSDLGPRIQRLNDDPKGEIR
jgi:HK97 gp10 family phage protein